MQISKKTAQRFVLGRQGLWPSRRWTGKSGTEKAMRTIEYLQLDPLDIGARAHDLILHSRVRNYKKSHYSKLVYDERKFFEWGGWLATRPIEEWPYWQVIMERKHKSYKKRWSSTTRHVTQEILQLLENEGPKRNREFSGGKIQKQYRGGKASSLALYQLWIAGQVVTCQRDRFERFYDLAHRFVPDELNYRASDAEAERFVLKKLVAFNGFSRLQSLNYELGKPMMSAKEQAAVRSRLLADDLICEITIEGTRQRQYVLTDDIGLLKSLEQSKIPKNWRSAGEPEVVFLSPLDVVSARGRAKKLFDFDYIWEVYKPEHQRRWGYYTLPILWGDQLVGRIEPSLDRSTQTLRVLGLWLENSKLAFDEKFGAAFSSALLELQTLFDATKTSIENSEKVNSQLRKYLNQSLKTASR